MEGNFRTFSTFPKGVLNQEYPSLQGMSLLAQFGLRSDWADVKFDADIIDGGIKVWRDINCEYYSGEEPHEIQYYYDQFEELVKQLLGNYYIVAPASLPIW